MKIYPSEIADVKIIRPKRIGDLRGFFSETYRKDILENAGIYCDFVQENHSLSAQRGVVRGLHYQADPRAQTKLVRVIRGAIFDVALDIRPDSPTFGTHVSMIISAEEMNQLLIPKGFAHGFATLVPNTEVLYKVDEFWDPEFEKGIFWNDPAIGIQWPISASEAIVSERDTKHPSFHKAIPR